MLKTTIATALTWCIVGGLAAAVYFTGSVTTEKNMATEIRPAEPLKVDVTEQPRLAARYCDTFYLELQAETPADTAICKFMHWCLHNDVHSIFILTTGGGRHCAIYSSDDKEKILGWCTENGVSINQPNPDDVTVTGDVLEI